MKKPLSKIVDVAIPVLAVAMGLYHLIYTQYLLEGPIEHQNTHLFFALSLVFLGTLRKHKKLRPLILLLLLLTIVSTGYIKVFYDALEARQGLPTRIDAIIGFILVIIVFEGVREAFGWVLPLVGLAFVIYTFAGQYLPAPFWHYPLKPGDVIASYAMGLTGMFGTALGISANYIFLFVLFGGLLQASGATKFFIEVGNLAGRRLAGGPAMTAVVSSALFGTATGIAGAAVAVTGPFTIPLMKRVGYKAEQAAAIEAVAGVGGAIMPPIMGVEAFFMAEFIGVPYIYVAAMAVIPSILYFLCLGLFVQLSALKLRVSPVSLKVDRHIILVTGPLFLIPLVTLTALMVIGYTPMYAAFGAIVALIPLSLIRKETRGSFRVWLQGFIDGATTGASIGVTCALVGVMTASITVTGIGVALPAIVEQLSGGILAVALMLIALVTVILGSGIPPLTAYIMVALMAVPAVIRMGVPLIPAHFFVMFYSSFALITPPVGLACVVAAPLAGASYLKTCVESVKAGAIAFVLPFLVIFVPIIILQPQEPLSAATSLIASVAMILLLQVLFVGYYFTEINLSERVVSGLSAVALIAFLFTQSYVLFATGLILGILLTIEQLRKRSLLKSRAVS